METCGAGWLGLNVSNVRQKRDGVGWDWTGQEIFQTENEEYRALRGEK